MASKKTISAQEFLELIKVTPEIKKNVIDIRDARDIKIYGKIIGSQILSKDQLQKSHKQYLVKKATYYIISQDGGEDGRVIASALRMFRRYDAIYVTGGYKAIIDARQGKE